MQSEIMKIIKFASSEELVKFEQEYKAFLESKAPKKIEKRGSKTKDLHKKVKEYLAEHKDLSYKEALKLVGKNMKELSK